jgi:phosphate transport system substrate-binding protein
LEELMKKIVFLLAVCIALPVLTWADSIELLGSGATLPKELYTNMFDVYAKEKGVKVNYNGIGSGGGIQNLIDRTVDFAGSDAPMKPEELKKAGADVIHIPTCVAAVAITYNLPAVKVSIRLSPGVLADIFLGKVTKWNDAAIASLNPGVKLPGISVIVITRADASGTTANFTKYLSMVSDDWKARVGEGKTVKWPKSLASGKGNDGVAVLVKITPGAIGYVEVDYAKKNGMAVGLIRNKSGNFVDPSNLNAVAMAGDIDKVPENAQMNILDTPAKNGYPIAVTTWILLYRDQSYTKSLSKSKAVVELVWWMIHDGQKVNETVNFAKMPHAALPVCEKLLRSVTFDGKPLVK